VSQPVQAPTTSVVFTTEFTMPNGVQPPFTDTLLEVEHCCAQRLDHLFDVPVYLVLLKISPLQVLAGLSGIAKPITLYRCATPDDLSPHAYTVT